jgi:heme A synthase
MRSAELVKRNLNAVWRDPLSLGLTVALPAVLLVGLQALGGVDSFFTATVLAPGIALFGFVMLMFGTAMALSRDRESALFPRLLATALRSNDFVAGYSLP